MALFRTFVKYSVLRCSYLVEKFEEMENLEVFHIYRTVRSMYIKSDKLWIKLLTFDNEFFQRKIIEVTIRSIGFYNKFTGFQSELWYQITQNHFSSMPRSSLCDNDQLSMMIALRDNTGWWLVSPSGSN